VWPAGGLDQSFPEPGTSDLCSVWWSHTETGRRWNVSIKAKMGRMKYIHKGKYITIWTYQFRHSSINAGYTKPNNVLPAASIYLIILPCDQNFAARSYNCFK
jgi:hypothetical protein